LFWNENIKNGKITFLYTWRIKSSKIKITLSNNLLVSLKLPHKKDKITERVISWLVYHAFR
jgi:hypothetical protein